MADRAFKTRDGVPFTEGMRIYRWIPLMDGATFYYAQAAFIMGDVPQFATWWGVFPAHECYSTRELAEAAGRLLDNREHNDIAEVVR